MFGIQGLQLAMVSDLVYDAVLTLSEASMNLLQSPNRDSRSQSIQDSQLEFTTTAFLRALEAAKECFLDMPGAWSTRRPIGGEFLNTISSHTLGRDFNSAIYWLFVRLGTSRFKGVSASWRHELMVYLFQISGRL